jgi:LacI family transcriptional regulator
MKKLIEQRKEELVEQKIDAVFAFGGPNGYCRNESITKKNLNIPEDVAVFGFGNTMLAQLVSPELTTIDLQTFELGRKSAEIILDEINGANFQNVNKLPISLIRRCSA